MEIISEQIWKNQFQNAHFSATYRFHKSLVRVRIEISPSGDAPGLLEFWASGKWNEMHTIPKPLLQSKYVFDRPHQKEDFQTDIDTLLNVAILMLNS